MKEICQPRNKTHRVSGWSLSYAQSHSSDLEEFRVGETHGGHVLSYDGPFEVRKKVGQVEYRLKLSETMHVHPTFHVN